MMYLCAFEVSIHICVLLQIKKSVTDFAKTADQPAPEKVNADEGVYYLVNPEGEFERAFGHDIDSLAIALAVCTSV